MKPPFFIVGCARSGTTLLRNLLRSHPSLTLPPESHFIPRFYKEFGDPATEADARRLASLILGTMWVKKWELGLTPDDFAGCRTYRDIVCRMYETYARKEGKPRWGEKTPEYVKELPTLRRVFPDAKIIHIIRDGRDVAHSWVQKRFGPQNYYTAAQAWKLRVNLGRREGRSSPETYHEVRFEELLANPSGTMRAVCEFLDEPYVDDLLRPTPPPGDLSSWKPWQLNSIATGNMGKWRSNLSPGERALFESVAGDLLRQLGYELEGCARSVPQYERFYWQVHQHACASAYELRRSIERPERIRTFVTCRLLDARDWLRKRTAPSQ